MGCSMGKKEATGKKAKPSTPGTLEPLLYAARSEHSTGRPIVCRLREIAFQKSMTTDISSSSSSGGGGGGST